MNVINFDSKDGYKAEVTVLDVAEWHAILQNFDDASIYQTYSYGSSRWPGSELRHLVLQEDGVVVAAAQVRLVRFPVFGGIAYIRWGPLWRRTNSEENTEVFRNIAWAIRKEFVENLGFTLRIIPRETEDLDDLATILEEEGYLRSRSDYNTVLIDIDATEDDLRRGLIARWRTDLNRSQRSELKLEQGDGLSLYDRFAPIYVEMFDRKNLVDFGDLEVYRNVQSELPAHLKMNIMLCSQEKGVDGAGTITSAIGDTGLAILWATNSEGRDTKGAYYLQWEVIRWLKQQGCRWYDLGGVNKEENPGGYRFKCGLSGKNGREVRFLGQFQASPSPLHGLFVDVALAMRDRIRKLRRAVKEVWSSSSKRG